MSKSNSQAYAKPSRARKAPQPSHKSAPSAAARKAKSTHAAPDATAPKGKLATITSMLRKPSGATIDALCMATGWQAHSVRGALSGIIKKKLDLKVVSTRSDGVRVYRIAQ